MFEIDFKIKNEYSNYLYQILQGINFNEYIWYLENDDVYFNQGKCFFETCRYDGVKFETKIKNNTYYLVFIKLYAQKEKKHKNVPEDINDINKDKSELIITIVDCEFVNIKSNSKKLITIIKRNIEMIENKI